MENFTEISTLGGEMAGALGERLRAERGARGLSQAQMGKLFGMSQSAYERIEAGRAHHQAATLERIDQGMIENGFHWYGGLARKLDLEIAESHDADVLERLDRIEAKVDEIRATQMGRAGQLLRQIRDLLDGLGDND